MSTGFDLILAGPVGSLEAYTAAVHRFPVLTADQERELATRYRRDGDLDAARQLVLSQLRFVVKIARGYSGYGLPPADLIQEGNIGLMKAVKRYDPSLNVRLISFAVHWIRAEIHEFVLRNWRMVKVATTKAQRKLFFNLRSAKKRLGWLNQEEVQEIARELGVSERSVMEMEARLSGQDISLEGSGPDSDETETKPAPIAYLQYDGGDPETVLENSDWDRHQSDALEAGLARLDARSRDILERRWLAEPKATLQELAADYKVSAERIRQLEQTALKRLRSDLHP